MIEPDEAKVRRTRLTTWTVSVLAVLFLCLMLWPSAMPLLAKRCPVIAWRYGTPEMQRYAAQVLITRIAPGMSYQEVLAILGPGSADWPALKNGGSRRRIRLALTSAQVTTTESTLDLETGKS